MAEVQRVREVQAVLKKLAAKYSGQPKASVTVGFTQKYAINVHENLEVPHNVGEAKYLEKPARALAPVLKDIILKAVSTGVKLETALLMVGLRLQRDAQLLTPVDTGALKASAFTCKTEDVDQVAENAYSKSQGIRSKVLAKREAKKQAKKAKK